MLNARTFQENILPPSIPVQDTNEPIRFNGHGIGFNHNPPSRGRWIFPFRTDQANRLGLQGFNFGPFNQTTLNHNTPFLGGFAPPRPRGLSPLGQAGRLGLQSFSNNTFQNPFPPSAGSPSRPRGIFPFGADRQELNFFDLDRVGQSKYEAIYNHLFLFMFYGVLIILQ